MSTDNGYKMEPGRETSDPVIEPVARKLDELLSEIYGVDHMFALVVCHRKTKGERDGDSAVSVASNMPRQTAANIFQCLAHDYARRYEFELDSLDELEFVGEQAGTLNA